MSDKPTNLFWTEDFGRSYKSTPIDYGFSRWLVAKRKAYDWSNSHDRTQRGVLLECNETLVDLYEQWMDETRARSSAG